MAAEEAKKLEPLPECPEVTVAVAEPEPEPQHPTAAPPAVEETKTLVSEEKPTDDSKTPPLVEKSVEPHEEKPVADRDVMLARVATMKKDAFIKAWEESEKSKIENKAQKKLAAIAAWENSKKAELEAEIRKIEEELEKKKAKYIEKTKNKLALLHKTAEEKRAITEAKRGEQVLKAEEVAAKCRATGATPKRGWFSS